MPGSQPGTDNFVLSVYVAVCGSCGFAVLPGVLMYV